MSLMNRWGWLAKGFQLSKKRNHCPLRATSFTHYHFGFEQLERRNLLAVFMVDNLNDDGTGSLRQAIISANNSAGADEIQFSVTGKIDIVTRLPTIVQDLTITGPGANLLTIDAGQGTDDLPGTDDGFRILDIDNGNANTFLQVAISGLTLTGGDETGRGGAVRSLENLTLNTCTITGNSASDEGGGVFERYGTLTVNNCTIANNRTVGDRNDGAGISALQAKVFVTGSLIAQNSTNEIDANGGGIAIRDGELTVNTSTISGNSVTGGGADGGGIYARNVEVTISQSLITGNTTNGANADGGGIFVREGSLFLRQSTVSFNAALFDNTANEQPSTGGGVSVSPNTELGQAAWIINSTISGNRVVDGAGGGLFTFSGTVHVIKSTITANEAPKGSGIASRSTASVTTKLISSIVSGNEGTDVDYFNYTANDPGINTFVSGGFNVIGTGNALDAFLTTDQTEVIDPLLGPLANNGGPTFTHALLPGSPALDAGSSALTVDQRGRTLPVDLASITNAAGSNGTDAGAYEAQTAPSADFDDDGDVDGRDFLLWQRGNGNSDDDNDTDASDLAAWQAAYGFVEISEAAAIPELTASDTQMTFETQFAPASIDAAIVLLMHQNYGKPERATSLDSDAEYDCNQDIGKLLHNGQRRTSSALSSTPNSSYQLRNSVGPGSSSVRRSDNTIPEESPAMNQLIQRGITNFEL